jgi:hypothetical protein
MGRRARWGLLSAALVLAAPWPARADDDRANREAEARFKEGLARVKTRDYEAARLSFEQAYAVLHRPLILWNLALSEEMTGHPLDALAHFRQVAHEAPSDQDRASAQKHVDGLLAQLGRIDVQAPPGTAIALDGGDVAATAPLSEPLDVTAGHHLVAAKMTAGATKTTDVNAVAGQITHVSFTADAPPPVVAVAPVAPVSSSTALATVQPTGEPPADQTHPFWTTRTTSAAIFTGAAVVVVGVAAGFGVASMNNKSTVSGFQSKYPDTHCYNAPTAIDCVAWNNAVNAQNEDANISDALYFAASALAVGALVSWFFWPKDHPKVAWVQPSVGPGTAGVQAGGHF